MVRRRMKRIIIVGAGPCGLVALKEMLEMGHNAILLEKSDRLGGVFSSAKLYSNLHLTISNWAMAFSDFPDPERLCYPSGEHYLQYLKAYAAHFDLEKRMMYGSEVCNACMGSDGRWTLEIKRSGDHIENMQSDALIVATGANQVAKPVPSELLGVSGRVLHSADYNEDFRRKVAEKKLRILVVGGELADLSPHVSVWLRRPACVGPRYLNNKPEMEQVAANKERDFPANGFLEAATTNRMSASLNVYAYGIFRRILWHTGVLNSTLARMCLDSTASAVLMNDQATYVTKNQRMCEAIHDGKLEALVSTKVSANGNTVTLQLANGVQGHRQFDAIVLCTGFATSFPWLKVDDLDTNPRSWFLHCFPEGLGDRLAFVGYARPHQGGMPVMAEMLSRYVALLFAGKRQLPEDYAERARREQIAEVEHYHISPHLSTLVDYNAFIESVARRVGCEPRLPLSIMLIFNMHIAAVLLLVLQVFSLTPGIVEPRLPFLLYVLTMALAFFIDDGLLIKWWFYPCWAVWYRQRGPGANPSLLEKTLRRVPLFKSTAITQGFMLLIAWSLPALYAQRILSVLIYLPYCLLDGVGVRWPKGWVGLLRPKMFALHGTEWRFSDLFVP
ncbi:uncharacterized protein LTR77_002099 [Saxophila tyrrhenica]|uniref:FAD/NAD(P)-binding domain-containing protein n=1 Tax=Saxophila tyrrhenica TaxID=1690608 RepID=A0AAV9PIH1_9PEZI|nr:hypothetical protein LTR77_002099 [Saxophila tyrrhenica]